MPIIRVEMFEGRTADQKRELVEVLTRESCRILGCTPQDVHVVIDNRAKENWGIAGKLASEK